MSSKCPAPSAYSHRAHRFVWTSCKFNFNVATSFAESCTFPPVLCSLLHTPRCFAQCCHKTVFLCSVYYLCQQRGPWIYQAKLRNTDSDRGNVDLVTSNALTCPDAQPSATHRLRIYLCVFHLTLCHAFPLFLLKQNRLDKNLLNENDNETILVPNTKMSKSTFPEKNGIKHCVLCSPHSIM